MIDMTMSNQHGVKIQLDRTSSLQEMNARFARIQKNMEPSQVKK